MVEGRGPAEILYGQVKAYVDASLSGIRRDDWRSSAERAKRRVFRRFKIQDLKPIMGTITVEELLQKFESKD